MSNQAPPSSGSPSYAVGVPVVPAIRVQILLRPLAFQSLNQGPLRPGMLLCFQRVFPQALDRAVAEVTPRIRQRCAFTATQTTIELLFKDYDNERDESRIRTAGHQMVSSLAGSLAHVTCKEPLRASLLRHMRVLIQGSSAANERLDQATSQVIEENLDRGCAMIEEAVSAAAVDDIDGEITYELARRGILI